MNPKVDYLIFDSWYLPVPRLTNLSILSSRLGMVSPPMYTWYRTVSTEKGGTPIKH